ncbi:Altered inheritance of mitochondria protein 41, mitochondrial [Neolecta irregularis DAH-3]|uniref:Altered inheritance of mitochondria protein 41 n=1 Tax=Neolecta irregularis (strain DAH-3) TaxID=1198029 RepID=A0A1U7LSW4_NEOID|nr:Altered inheritance of mitochondria protein 41, mitochondrial [Neolecta irregularis DAH-3]|eukprot:OLL25708.1 Altered inheritance of mitochondria protein 41, mitochondrial [Neolecta irregularis DAH-3]
MFRKRLIFHKCLRFNSTSVSQTPTVLLQIRQDIKTSMKQKDKQKLNVLKTVISDITYSTHSPKPITTTAEIIHLLQSSMKKHLDSANEFRLHGRQDLAQNEEEEAEILKSYCPKPISADDLNAKLQGITDIKNAFEVLKEELKMGVVSKRSIVERLKHS